MQPQKKILIFYSQAGGGHESMAKIIKQRLQPEYLVTLENIAEEHTFFSSALTHGYVWLTEKTPFLWGLLSMLWKNKFFIEITKILMRFQVFNRINEIIKTQQPDIVISTYYLINTYVRSISPKIPTYTIVSDIFAVQNIWFYDKTDTYIVFSEKSLQLGIDNNIPHENIFLCDPVFSTLYNKKPNQTELQNCFTDLKIAPSRLNKKILIVGGGSSIPNGTHIFQEIIKIPEPLEIYIVCGRNKKLKKKLQDLCTLNTELVNNKTIHIFEFIPYIRELITIADIIITKAGPGIILEILSQQKPLIISHYIWEQEKPNMEFVVENNFGIYEPEPYKIANHINEIIKNPTIWEPYIITTKNYHLKNGTLELGNYFRHQL